LIRNPQVCRANLAGPRLREIATSLQETGFNESFHAIRHKIEGIIRITIAHRAENNA